MPEDNKQTIQQLADLNKTTNATKDIASQTLGEMRGIGELNKKTDKSLQTSNRSLLLQTKQIEDNKVAQDLARENQMELTNALNGLKDGFSFFKENLKNLGLGAGAGVLESLATKLQAAFNLLLSPIAMLSGFIVGIGQGLGAATRAAKNGSKLTQLFSLPLLTFNKAIQSITKLVGTRTAFLTKAGGPIWNIKQLYTTFTAGFKFDSINKSATKFQKSVFNIGQQVRKVGKSFGAAGELFKKLAAPFQGLVNGAKAIGKVVGKLFAPLNFIFVAFETVTTSMERFKTDGIFGGIVGAIEGLVKGLVTIPLDLIKDGIAWIAGKLGFEDFSELLKGFSLTQGVTKIADGILMLPEIISTFMSEKVAALKETFTVWKKDFSAQLSEGWSNFTTSLSELPGQIMEALSSAGDWVKDKIKILASKLNPLNWFKKEENPADMTFAGEFAKGGNIPAGKFGLVGERGPEFVGGPSSVMSADKSRSMMQTATKLMGGTGDDVDIKGQVLFTRETGKQALESFNAALASAGIQEKITLDELKQAQMDGIENTSNRVGDLYDQFLRKTETAALDISDAFDISLDDFDLNPPSGGFQIAQAEDDLADAQMDRQGSTNAVMNSGNVTSSIVTSSNTIVSGVNTRNEDSISYLNRSM
jgi:hypothetical protein